MTKVTHEPSPYDGRGGSPSFFRDLYVVQAAEQRRKEALEDPRLRGADPGEPAKRNWPSVEEAAARLRGINQRDLSSGAVGTTLNATDMPPAIADMFAPFNHAVGVLPDAMGVTPLSPGFGMTLRMPRATSGASADVQNPQNNAVSETDPVYDEAETNIATIAGTLVGSMQLLDRSTTNPDLGIARELGMALSAKIDSQILSGTGSNGQTMGLLTAAGTTSIAAASASVEDTYQAIGEAYEAITTNSGAPPDLALMHPRREAVLRLDAITNSRPVQLPGNLQIVGVPSMPITLGPSTGEDRIVLLRRVETPLFLGPRSIRYAFGGAETANLKWRLVAHQYCALMPERRPESIAIITGLTAPTW